VVSDQPNRPAITAIGRPSRRAATIAAASGAVGGRRCAGGPTDPDGRISIPAATMCRYIVLLDVPALAAHCRTDRPAAYHAATCTMSNSYWSAIRVSSRVMWCV
jgi:hypothetical protein